MSFFRKFGGSKTSQRSSGSDNESSANSSPKGSTGDALTLTKTTSSSRLGRVFSGGFRSRKLSNKTEWAHLHKPFTPENLEHQKILNTFEWSFGSSRASFDSQCSGVSPCTSRRGSMSDGERSLPPFDCADLSARMAKSAIKDDDEVAPDVIPAN